MSVTRQLRILIGFALVLVFSMGMTGCPGTPLPVDPGPQNPDPGTDPNNNPDPGTDPNTDPNNPGNNPDPGTPDPNAGFTIMPALRGGSEALIAGSNVTAAAGFVPPANFNIGRIALSGDGKYVWFYLFWDSISTAPADWIRLYCIDTSGMSAQRSMINEEAEAIGGGFLASSFDGSSAIYEMQRCEFAPVICRSESRFLKMAPGGTATPFYDTENDAGLPSVGGPRLTNDGQMAFWHENERLWRVSTAGGAAQELASVAHLNFNGPWNPFTGGQLFGVDITSNGGEWLLGVRFTDPNTNQLRWELVKGAGALPQTMTGISKQTTQALLPAVQMSADGGVIGYEESNAFGQGGSFVQSGTFAGDLRNATSPNASGAYNLVLARSGNRALIEVNISNQRTPVFHDVSPGRRLRAGTSCYAGTAGGVHSRQISTDGTVSVGLWNARAIGTPLNNLYVLRDGATNLAGHPQIGEVRIKYDATADALAIRVHATSNDGLDRVYLLPMYRGIEPVGAIADAQNPLYDERYGGGVNLSTVFTPVTGLADTYERVIPMKGKYASLSEHFAGRIIAINKDSTRTTYRDYSLKP